MILTQPLRAALEYAAAPRLMRAWRMNRGVTNK